MSTALEVMKLISAVVDVSFFVHKYLQFSTKFMYILALVPDCVGTVY